MSLFGSNSIDDKLIGEFVDRAEESQTENNGSVAKSDARSAGKSTPTPPPFTHFHALRNQQSPKRPRWAASFALLAASLAATASLGSNRSDEAASFLLQNQFGFFRSLSSQESLNLDWSSLHWMGNLKGLELAASGIAEENVAPSGASASTETAPEVTKAQPRVARTPKRSSKRHSQRSEHEKRQLREIHQYLRQQVLSQALWGAGQLSWIARMDSIEPHTESFEVPVTQLVDTKQKKFKKAKKHEYSLSEYSIQTRAARVRNAPARTPQTKVLEDTAAAPAEAVSNLADEMNASMQAIVVKLDQSDERETHDWIWISKSALAPVHAVYAAETPAVMPEIFKRKTYPKRSILNASSALEKRTLNEAKAERSDRALAGQTTEPPRSQIAAMKEVQKRTRIKAETKIAAAPLPREIRLNIPSRAAVTSRASLIKGETKDAVVLGDENENLFQTGVSSHDSFLQSMLKVSEASMSYDEGRDYSKQVSPPQASVSMNLGQTSGQTLSQSQAQVQTQAAAPAASPAGWGFAYVSPSSLTPSANTNSNATPSSKDAPAVRINRNGILAQAKEQAKAVQYVAIDRMKIEMGSSAVNAKSVQQDLAQGSAQGSAMITVSRPDTALTDAPKTKSTPEFVEAMNWKDPILGGTKESVSLEGALSKKTDRGTQWVLARASDHLTTLSLARTPSLGKGTPLLSFNSRNALSLVSQTQINQGLGILFGRLPTGMTLNIDGRSEAALYFPENTELQSFILFNVEPGARIVSIHGKQGERVSALAAPVLSKTATFLDLSVFEDTQVRGWVLSGDNAKAQGLPGVLVRAVGHPKAAQKTDRWGRFLFEGLKTAPGHPIYLESEAAQGDTHRYAVPESMWGGVSLFRFSATRVDALSKQLEGGLHSTSGLLIAAFPYPEALTQEGGAVFPRLVPVEASNALVPETYTLNGRDELLVNTPLRGENRRAIAVQVPEGLNRLELEDVTQKIVWSSFLISSPGVINVVLPE